MVGRCISYWNSPFLGDIIRFPGCNPFVLWICWMSSSSSCTQHASRRPSCLPRVSLRCSSVTWRRLADRRHGSALFFPTLPYPTKKILQPAGARVVSLYFLEGPFFEMLMTCDLRFSISPPKMAATWRVTFSDLFIYFLLLRWAKN